MQGTGNFYHLVTFTVVVALLITHGVESDSLRARLSQGNSGPGREETVGILAPILRGLHRSGAASAAGAASPPEPASGAAEGGAAGGQITPEQLQQIMALIQAPAPAAAPVDPPAPEYG